MRNYTMAAACIGAARAGGTQGMTVPANAPGRGASGVEAGLRHFC
ncbi:hypothetical protein [Ottowia sp.]